MSKMPIDVKKLLETMTDIGQKCDEPVAVDVIFDPSASEALTAHVLDAFLEPSCDARVNTEVLGARIPDVPVPADLAVIVGGTSPLLGDVASAARAKGIPAVVVVARGDTYFSEEAESAGSAAGSTLEGAAAKAAGAGAASAASGAPGAGQSGRTGSAPLRKDPGGTVASGAGADTDTAGAKGIPLSDIIDVDVSGAPERPLEELGTWIARNASSKRTSMAKDFPFLRHPLALELGRENAIQNGAIGTVFFVPGADMPLITLNQARMVIQIAAVYGHTLSRDRAKEVVSVVAGGFGFRALARKLAAQIPVLGWAIKPSVAAGGTLAMAYAAVDYYEEGGVINGLAEGLENAVGKVADVVGNMVGKSLA